jgi:hypothetical protein
MGMMSKDMNYGWRKERIRGGGPPFLPTLLTVQYIHIKFLIPSTSLRKYT